MAEEKKCISGKLKLHRYKGELSVLSIVIFVHCTKQYPASLFDPEVFRQNEYFHHEASKKGVRDCDVQDQRLVQEM